MLILKMKKVVLTDTFRICLILVIIILLCKDYYKQTYKESFTNKKFDIVCLSTPNYDHIGCYGANIIKKYADRHGYSFTLYRDLPKSIFDNGKNISKNFGKNYIVMEKIKEKTGSDYIVLVDTDTIVVDPTIRLEELFVPKDETTFYAPDDRWFNPNTTTGCAFNSGFIIWKNNERAYEINKYWLDVGYKGCKGRESKTTCGTPIAPPQQNAYLRCVKNNLKIKDEEQGKLDHNLVGMPYSKIFRSSKKLRSEWIKVGSPDNLNCKII